MAKYLQGRAKEGGKKGNMATSREQAVAAALAAKGNAKATGPKKKKGAPEFLRTRDNA